MKSEVLQKKGEDQLKQQAICAHELQSALSLKVGLSDIYCEL
jgi:hypothetical protein